MGTPKFCSMVLTSWPGPSVKAALMRFSAPVPAIGTLAADLAVATAVGVVEALAGVRADHQQVERAAAARLVQPRNLHRADLAETVVHVAVPGRGRHDQEHQEQAAPHQ
jgi:hypothetical protein